MLFKDTYAIFLDARKGTWGIFLTAQFERTVKFTLRCGAVIPRFRRHLMTTSVSHRPGEC